MNTSSAWPAGIDAEGTAGAGASKIRTRSLSPGCMSSVLLLGSEVALSAACGLGGPVGMPSRCTKAKFVVSSQLGLHDTKPNVHSSSLMCSDAHHDVLLQLTESMNGASPGG